MIAASTFVPAPADTFVLALSSSLSPVTIGVVGGLINALVVSVVERRWVLLVLDHPFFERFSGVFGAESDEEPLDNTDTDSQGWTHKTVNWAKRHMFAGLVVGGASVLPFEPFRLLAITSGYPPARYALATFISRGARYWAIAEFGQILSGYGWLKPVIYVTLTIFFIGVARSMIKFWKLETAASE